MLTDLEEMQHGIEDKATRLLVAEVVKCYEAGAYRAALVSLWVAVVADITAKIRALAESGDGEAQNVISSLDAALANRVVQKVQEYERNILEVAERRLQILLSRERVELERLNEDRNLCAHPGYVDEALLYIPDAEIVRAHLVAARRAVFCQRPQAGKRMLNVLKQEIESDSWPSDERYFIERFYSQVRETVKRNMTKVVIKHGLRPPDNNMKIAERSVAAAFAVAREAPECFEQSLAAILEQWESTGALEAAVLVRAVGAFGRAPAFWRALPATAKKRFLELLHHCDFDILINNGLFVSGPVSDETVLGVIGEVIDNLTDQQLDAVIEVANYRKPFIPRLIDAVEVSATYREAEENLRRIVKCSEPLSADNVRLLHEAIRNNRYDQVRCASGTELLLGYIYQNGCPNQDAHNEWKKMAAWLRDEARIKQDPYDHRNFVNMVMQDA